MRFYRQNLACVVLSLLCLTFLFAFAGCATSNDGMNKLATVAELEALPLQSTDWRFGQIQGAEIRTPHYRIYTTVQNSLYHRLIACVLDAAYTRFKTLNPQTNVAGPLDCYVLGDRSQWELFTKLNTGENAKIYMNLSAGGYAHQGIFVGYDLGRETTLSVVAHEAWHQYSWFAFKDHLPSWLEEGIASQNENINWNGTTPMFVPEQNYRRYMALKAAIRENRLWSMSELISTNAGRVVRRSQKDVDAYYAQVWSLALFLEHSRYKTNLMKLIDDARTGRLAAALSHTKLTQAEIDSFSERWNTVAGPVYFKKYINSDMAAFEKEYRQFISELTGGQWPPKLK